MKKKHKGNDNIWIGIVLIGLGILFFLHNIDVLDSIDNWWALFILIPAFGSLAAAWNGCSKSGKNFTSHVRDEIFAGLLLLFVAVIFLFELDWGKVWPFFIVLVGLEIVLESLQKRDS